MLEVLLKSRDYSNPVNLRPLFPRVESWWSLWDLWLWWTRLGSRRWDGNGYLLCGIFVIVQKFQNSSWFTCTCTKYWVYLQSNMNLFCCASLTIKIMFMPNGPGCNWPTPLQVGSGQWLAHRDTPPLSHWMGTSLIFSPFIPSNHGSTLNQ